MNQLKGDDGYAIVLFAHNEERNILSSLTSIIGNIDENLKRITIIANGCTDNTTQILYDYKCSSGEKRLKIVELELGDKCNAWNYYVHRAAENYAVHFFCDADVYFTENAFPIMFNKLKNSEYANAIAGIPFSGRNSGYYRDLIVNGRCLFGNCYGLKSSFLSLVQANGFRLPIGLSWIDSAITKVVNRDLEDVKNPKEGKIVYDLNCGYKFNSLSMLKPADWRLYINRITRYRLGKMQEKHLEKLSFLSWPDDVREINALIGEGLAKRSFFNLWDRYLVANRIKRFEQKFQ